MLLQVEPASVWVFCTSANKDDINVAIIGGGIMGASLAYHLAEHGVSDVVVLEKDNLTSGCTWHASCGFHRCGTIRLIATEERLNEAQFQISQTGWHPSPISLISPERVKELHPLLNTEKLLGGIHSPGDGYVDPYQLTHALMSSAKRMGVSVHEKTRVDSVTSSGGVWKIDTSRGLIKAHHLVNAAGLWARDLGHMVGLDLPVVQVEHQYVITSAIDEVKSCKQTLPVLRDLEGSCYIRQEMNSILFGPYESSDEMELRADWYDKGTPKDFSMTLFDSSLDRVSSYIASAMEYLPCTQDVQLHRVVNGPMPYTPDGHGLAGLCPGFDNLWMMCGFTYGIIQAGGVGKYLADWMVRGEPSSHIFDIDPARYGNWASKRSYALPKVRETYGHNNIISYPREERPAGRPTHRISPLHEKLGSSGACFGHRNGWEVPLWFTSPGDPPAPSPSFGAPREWSVPVQRELDAARTGATVLDTTAFGKILVKGEQAAEFISYSCFDFDGNEDRHSAQLCHMLTNHGRLYGQMLVVSYHNDSFLCVTEPNAELHHYRWLHKLSGNFRCDVTTMTDEIASLALIGPRSADLVGTLSKDGDMQCRAVQIGGVDATVAKRGFAGCELFELFVDRQHLVSLYECLKSQSKELNDIGLYAYDELRVEVGFKRWPTEICVDYTPQEAGLNTSISKSTNFVGQSALKDANSQPITRQLVQMVTTANLEGSETIWLGDEPVGFVTSARNCSSNDGRKTLALCYVSPHCADGKVSDITVETLGNRLPISVV